MITTVGSTDEIHPDKLLVDRNAARWLRKLAEHGYLKIIRSGADPAAA